MLERSFELLSLLCPLGLAARGFRLRSLRVISAVKLSLASRRPGAEGLLLEFLLLSGLQPCLQHEAGSRESAQPSSEKTCIAGVRFVDYQFPVLWRHPFGS